MIEIIEELIWSFNRWCLICPFIIILLKQQSQIILAYIIKYNLLNRLVIAKYAFYSVPVLMFLSKTACTVYFQIVLAITFPSLFSEPQAPGYMQNKIIIHVPILISSERQWYGTSNSWWFQAIVMVAVSSLSTLNALISASKHSFSSSLVCNWKIIHDYKL